MDGDECRGMQGLMAYRVQCQPIRRDDRRLARVHGGEEDRAVDVARQAQRLVVAVRRRAARCAGQVCGAEVLDADAEAAGWRVADARCGTSGGRARGGIDGDAGAGYDGRGDGAGAGCVVSWRRAVVGDGDSGGASCDGSDLC